MSHSLLNIIVIIISFYKGGVLKSSYCSDVPSDIPTLLPHPETSKIYLTPLPPHPLARDVIYGWPFK